MSSLFTKDLKGTLESVVSKAKVRRDKIQSKITFLEQEVHSVTEQIKSENERLVQCEMDDNQSGQAQSRKNITVLRKKLKDAEDLLEAYRDELSKPIDEDEVQKIRAAAIKEREDRIAEVSELRKKKDEIRANIKQLEKQIEDTDKKIFLTDQETELNTLYNSVLWKYIDSRTLLLVDYSKKMDYVKQWMHGPVGDSFFENGNKKPVPADEFKGFTSIIREPKPEVDKGIRTMHKTLEHVNPQDFLNAWKLHNPDKTVLSFEHNGRTVKLTYQIKKLAAYANQ